jgi:hypothetical protein
LKHQKPISERIQALEDELSALDAKRKVLQDRIRKLKSSRQSIADEQLPFDRLPKSNVTNDSTREQKIALFRSLFQGREDIYPRRFESKRIGKSGYQPVCRNEWIRPICKKPKIKCGDCENRDFTPLSDDVIRNHLIGIDPTDRYRREFVIGVYLHPSAGMLCLFGGYPGCIFQKGHRICAFTQSGYTADALCAAHGH